jgi:hypothetical protein
MKQIILKIQIAPGYEPGHVLRLVASSSQVANCTEITPKMLLEALLRAERSKAADMGKFSVNWFLSLTGHDIMAALEEIKP